MNRNRGFTLIELLVVIAIIALLLSIIVPSLKVAREVASGAVCLNNQKGLATAWHIYQGEHNGLLVGGSTYHSGNNASPYRWVERPLYNDTDNPEFHAYPPDAQFNMEYRLNGIRAGRLYPYVGSEKMYHCPGDRTFVREEEPRAVYRSYSISGLMNGEDFVNRQSGLYSPINTYRTVTMPGGQPRELRVAVRFSEIQSPGTKYVFVEEDVATKGQTHNLGSFVLMGGGNYWQWWDWPAYYHNDQSTLGFADGHAIKRRWQDRDTVRLMRGDTDVRLQEGNPDLEWMNRGYLPRP